MDVEPGQLKRRENTGATAAHKAWLGPTLAGPRRKIRKTRFKIHQCVTTASSADHIASWLVAFVIEKEWRHPSIRQDVRSNISSFRSSMELLSHTKGTRNSTAIGFLFEEAMRFALSGESRTTRGGQGSGPRRECQQLIALHGPTFKAIFDFPTSKIQLPTEVIVDIGEQWATAYQNQIQEHLFNTILHIVNVFTAAKDVRAAARFGSSQQKRAAQRRLKAIATYKKWLANDPDGAIRINDNAIRRTHNVLGPIIAAHGSPLSFIQHRSRRSQVNEKPLIFLPLFLATLEVLAAEPMLKSARPRLSLPVRRSFIPKHIRLDAGALSTLSPSLQYDPRDNSNKSQDKREQERHSIFRYHFDLTKRPFASEDEDGNTRDVRWTLGSSIATDGYAISVIKARSGAAPKGRAERSKSSRGDAAARRRQGQDASSFPDLTKMTDEEVLHTQGRAIFVDPGKQNIAFALPDKDDRRVTFRYTSAMRRRGLGTAILRRRLVQLERNLPPDLKTALKIYRENPLPSSRVFSEEGIAAWLRVLNTHFRSMTAIYSKPLFRTQRMLSYSRNQREWSRVIKTIVDKFGADAQVFVGNWGASNIKGSPPSPSRKSFQNELFKAGFDVYTIDEFRTSSYCPDCSEKVYKSKKTTHPNPALKKLGWIRQESPRGLLICTSETCRARCKGGDRYFDRDLLGAANMRLVYRTRIAAINGSSESARPPHLSRQRRNEDNEEVIASSDESSGSGSSTR
ncbi:unnamed protein product [Tilletia caries]|nr:unnamed protein product [Tilletia caries]